MLFDQGKLEKMKVSAFLPTSDPNAAPQVSKKPEDTYVVQVNPRSYSLDHLIHYANRRGQGRSGSDAVYTGTEPAKLDFEFLFDGTGVVPQQSELSDVPLVGAIASALSPPGEFEVGAEIMKFAKVVYAYEGEDHRPRKVLLIWGTFSFPCALVSLSYRFTLFKPDGTPLRAVASASFRETRTDAERARQENNSSPDLTHLREIQAGDTLPLLAHRIYGKSSLYLEVARVNKLVNFRRLPAGSRVSLPPLAKSAAPGKKP